MGSDSKLFGIRWELLDNSRLMLIICLNFRPLITAKEPDELERYLALKDQCTDRDMATEIFPHYKDVSLWWKGNDCSWSGAFCHNASRKNKMVRETQWKTSEIAVSHCILGDKQLRCTAPNFRQCTASSFTPSTFLLSKDTCYAACFSYATWHLFQCSLYRLLLRDFLLTQCVWLRHEIKQKIY